MLPLPIAPHICNHYPTRIILCLFCINQSIPKFVYFRYNVSIWIAEYQISSFSEQCEGEYLWLIKGT